MIGPSPDPDADTQEIPVVTGPPAAHAAGARKGSRDAILLWVGAGAVVGLGALVVFGGGLGSGDPSGPRGSAPPPATGTPPAAPSPAAGAAPPVIRPTAQVPPAIDLRVGARPGKTVWVEVRRRGASGKSLFAGIVGNGVTRRVTSSGPLWLGVAWAPNVTVAINGDEIDAEGGTESYRVTARGLSRFTSP